MSDGNQHAAITAALMILKYPDFHWSSIMRWLVHYESEGLASSVSFHKAMVKIETIWRCSP